MQTYFDLIDTIPPGSREESLNFFKGLFNNNNPFIVEIGSGNGHFLVEFALKNPDKNFIGTEILNERAKKFHVKIQRGGFKNVVVFRGDSRRFLWDFIFEDTVEEFIIFFPDPWPKRRHHKHRLLNGTFIDMLHFRLIPGCIVSIATDYPEYRDWIIEEFNKTGGFINLFEKGYNLFPDYFPKSLFEERFRKAGHNIYYIKYKKVNF